MPGWFVATVRREGGVRNDLGEFLSHLLRRGPCLQLAFVSCRRRALAFTSPALAARRSVACAPGTWPGSGWTFRRSKSWRSRPDWPNLAFQLRNVYGVSGVVRWDRLSAHALLDGLVCYGAGRGVAQWLAWRGNHLSVSQQGVDVRRRKPRSRGLRHGGGAGTDFDAYSRRRHGGNYLLASWSPQNLRRTHRGRYRRRERQRGGCDSL